MGSIITAGTNKYSWLSLLRIIHIVQINPNHCLLGYLIILQIKSKVLPFVTNCNQTGLYVHGFNQLIVNPFPLRPLTNTYIFINCTLISFTVLSEQGFKLLCVLSNTGVTNMIINVISVILTILSSI